MHDDSFEVIVIGGGHAGCEAAAVCARMGVRTLLLTQNPARIGVLSCNPSIGGIGKSHLVREVDALDGLMARAADEACIHNKTLNRSKGPAVRGVRIQADRSRYSVAVRRMLQQTPGLTIRAGEADGLELHGDGSVRSVLTGGVAIACKSLVIAAGTFLRGVTHVGDEQTPAGRRGDAPSVTLAACLDRLGVKTGRLKTGTPPRLVRSTIDWESLPADWGDADPAFLSFETRALALRQIECRVTATNRATHALIEENLSRSALYVGNITAPGPRYCPSIEDKIVRFADRDRHQVFLEPEGLPDGVDWQTVYPNGISTSLPADIQLRLVRTMVGLGRACISAPGYAVEYDFIHPSALDHSLHLHAMPGVFLAGQITGTTGYEEAAAQGIYAGINAARWAQSKPAVVLDRATSYVGVMVDDLVSAPLIEPYRMFTSRAEYRLQLRCDNADLRLTPLGIGIGCVSADRRTAFQPYRTEVERALNHARTDCRSPRDLDAAGIPVKQDGVLRTLFDVASSDCSPSSLETAFPWLKAFSPAVRDQITTTGLYSGYLHRQESEVALMRAASFVAASTVERG